MDKTDEYIKAYREDIDCIRRRQIYIERDGSDPAILRYHQRVYLMERNLEKYVIDRLVAIRNVS